MAHGDELDGDICVARMCMLPVPDCPPPKSLWLAGDHYTPWSCDHIIYDNQRAIILKENPRKFLVNLKVKNLLWNDNTDGFTYKVIHTPISEVKGPDGKIITKANPNHCDIVCWKIGESSWRTKKSSDMKASLKRYRKHLDSNPDFFWFTSPQ